MFLLRPLAFDDFLNKLFFSKYAIETVQVQGAIFTVTTTSSSSREFFVVLGGLELTPNPNP
jgi:hypothetical protein